MKVNYRTGVSPIEKLKIQVAFEETERANSEKRKLGLNVYFYSHSDVFLKKITCGAPFISDSTLGRNHVIVGISSTEWMRGRSIEERITVKLCAHLILTFSLKERKGEKYLQLRWYLFDRSITGSLILAYEHNGNYPGFEKIFDLKQPDFKGGE